MKRAVIYCRTSTTEESQLNALENQVQEASACVKTQGWQLVDSYVESGSGTTTHGRDQYKRLYEDLLLDRFDIIVIKSQDRLMRNVKDWYLFLDCLIRCGKQLYLYLEQKFFETVPYGAKLADGLYRYLAGTGPLPEEFNGNFNGD